MLVDNSGRQIILEGLPHTFQRYTDANDFKMHS